MEVGGAMAGAGGGNGLWRAVIRGLIPAISWLQLLEK